MLALTTGTHDMQERLGRMVVASDKDGHPVSADDLVDVQDLFLIIYKLALKNIFFSSGYYRGASCFNDGCDQANVDADFGRDPCPCTRR